MTKTSLLERGQDSRKAERMDIWKMQYILTLVLDFSLLLRCPKSDLLVHRQGSTATWRYSCVSLIWAHNHQILMASMGEDHVCTACVWDLQIDRAHAWGPPPEGWNGSRCGFIYFKFHHREQSWKLLYYVGL